MPARSESVKQRARVVALENLLTSGKPQLRRAVRTSVRLGRYAHCASRALFRRRSVCNRFLEPIHLFNDQEDGKRNDQEVYDRVEEIAVGDDRSPCRFRGLEIRIALVIERDEVVFEV